VRVALGVVAALVAPWLVSGCVGDGTSRGSNPGDTAPGARKPGGRSFSSSPAPATASTSGAATAASSSGPGDATLRFAVIGDWGSGSSTERALAARMCRWRASHPFDLVVTTGDNIYPNGAGAYFSANFFEPFKCLLDAGVQFRSALGNHDIVTLGGSPELGTPAFGMNGRNYVFRNSGVRFVVADSNSLDREWLRGALTTESGDRWTIVSFHHPVFSPGTEHGSTPGFRPGLPRMFRNKGVDLVLNGHDHIYAATKALHRIRYVVTGGGGASIYECSERWFVRKCRARNHFVYVLVRRRDLVVKAVASSGHVFDRFTATGHD
jgi:Calcineurin-like phosphoesterase